ncbi:hypothetical protein OAS39_05265, partial [Pirellulales bacterium]|nr:hypothetical protein [Pirellulales bacterium]
WDFVSWTPGGAFVPGPPADRAWLPDAGGNWNDTANWNSGQVPNGNDQTAILGGVVTSPRTLFSNSPVTAKRVRFDSPISYAVAGAGPGMLLLESDTGSASIEVTGGAGAGAHQFQIPVTLMDDTDADIGAGASLAINNALHLGTTTLTKTGAGSLLINSHLGSGSATVIVSDGVLGGNGRIFGDVTSPSGATVAPGTSTGKLTVAGDYTHQLGATLSIELGGVVAGTSHDVFDVSGSMSLTGGTLEVLLVDAFNPSPGDSFDILEFASLAGAFTSLILPVEVDWNTSNLLTTGALSVADADFDQDGDVDGADFLAGQRGFGTAGGATLADGDANGDGNVDGLDLAIWENTYRASTGALSATASVPEPGCSILAVFALLGFRRRACSRPMLSYSL